MTNKNYNNGRAFEYKVRDHFLDIDYQVFRTAGSHTKADLICMLGVSSPSQEKITTIVTLVQCKTSKGLMSVKQRNEFKKYCDDLGVYGVIAYRDKRKLKLDYL